MNFQDNIPDITHYNNEMQKGMLDKLFFIDIIDADVIVDYGCANGAMLAKLKQMYPNKTYIGYDISESEIEIATRDNPEILFYSNWNGVKEYLTDFTKLGIKTAVVCSSIIHEVYHYGDHNDVTMFWERIYGTGFDWVVIRDMCVSRSLSRPSDSVSVVKVRQNYNPESISEFERHWGTLESNWSFVHFLLKYRYTKNWSREVKENYFPLDYESLLNKIPKSYVPVLVDHFIHPFTRMQVEKDFGIQLQDRTHLKLILKKN